VVIPAIPSHYLLVPSLESQVWPFLQQPSADTVVVLYLDVHSQRLHVGPVRGCRAHRSSTVLALDLTGRLVQSKPSLQVSRSPVLAGHGLAMLGASGLRWYRSLPSGCLQWQRTLVPFQQWASQQLRVSRCDRTVPWCHLVPWSSSQLVPCPSLGATVYSSLPAAWSGLAVCCPSA
jgi:hypothetical protein